MMGNRLAYAASVNKVSYSRFCFVTFIRYLNEGRKDAF